MKATEIGRHGEDIAEDYLVAHGYEIVERNWRTRYCEIDIVAKKDKTVYFVEVKYRKSSTYGSGFEYITPKKQQQMQFAAEMWLQANRWDDEASLAAMSITGGAVEFIDVL